MAITTEVVNLTPTQAAKLLETNHVNRRPKKNVISAWRHDMEQGRWELTGEAIKVSRTGALLDGQNRLMALREANVDSVPFLMVYGLPDEVQRYMDSGTARSVADALRLQYGDIQYLVVASSVARWLSVAPVPTGEMLGQLRRKVSTAAALEAFGSDPEGIRLAAQRGVSIRATVAPVSPTALAYTWLHLHRVDSEACGQFFWGMTDLNFQGDRDPRKAALRRLMAMALEEHKGHNWSVSVVSVLTRSWNAWRKGEEMASITARGPKGMVDPVRPI